LPQGLTPPEGKNYLGMPCSRRSPQDHGISMLQVKKSEYPEFEIHATFIESPLMRSSDDEMVAP
jgi:hypothetical protein